MSKVITIDGIEINIIFKNVKNINIRISKDGKVFVSANKDLHMKYLDEFLESKKKWIKNGIKRMNKFNEKKEYNKKVEIKTGEALILFGDKFILHIFNSDIDNKEYGKIINNDINIYVNDDDIQKKEYILNKLIEKYTVNVIKRKFELIKERVNIQNVSLTLRKMKTRWGICNITKRKITINTELVNFQSECLDYVIIHEFVHFLEKGHNKRFYKFVEDIMPDYVKYMKILNKSES